MRILGAFRCFSLAMAACLALSTPLRAEDAQQAGPSLLVTDSLTGQDQGVLDCVEKKSPERLRALMGLEVAEKRIEDRFAGLQQWIIGNSDAGDGEIRAKLDSIYAETEAELKTHLSPSGKDATLNAYRTAEASRILAETSLRLCIAGVADAATVDAFRAKAGERLKRGYDALSMLDTKKRESEIPAVLARMARTELSAAQLDRMRDSQSTYPSKEFDRMDSVVEKYRKMSGRGQEKRELDMIQLEAALSLDQPEIGSRGGVISLEDSRRKKFEAIKSELDVGIRASKSPRYLARASHLRSVAGFYGVDRASRDEALAGLSAGLNSSDPQKRGSAERVATDLLAHLGGTTLGRRVLDVSNQAKASEGFRESVEKFIKDDAARARAYDSGMEKAMGKPVIEKLGLASYDELVRSDGSLKNHQQEYVEALGKIGELQTAKTKNPKSVSDADLQLSLGRADMQWTYLRCAREQLGVVPGKDSSSSRLRSPFGNFDINVEGCRKLRGSSRFHQSSMVSSTELQDAIIRRRNKQLAWLAGDFAFDVATVLATGGASALVKAPIKAGLRKAGTVMLRKEMMSPTVIRAGVRATGLVANTLATDLSVQTVKASRMFLEAGLRGRWDLSLFTEGTAYTQKEAKPARHATRLLATAAANKGLDVLWGRARLLAPAVADRIGSTKLGAWMGESGKGAVNTQLGGFAGDVATIPFDGCQKITESGILSGEKWVASMKETILGQIKGAAKGSARYMGATFVERLDDFGIDSVTPDQMAELQSCTLPPQVVQPVAAPIPAVNQEGKAQ
jgi:hypothetical protein